MKKRHRWAAAMCFYCKLLDVRTLKNGRVSFWCGKRKAPLPDSFIWKRKCRGFAPARPAA